VHVIPVVAKELDKKSFNQTVVPNHFKSKPLTLRCELHTLIALVFDQAPGMQALDGHCYRGRRVSDDVRYAPHWNLLARAPRVVYASEVILVILGQLSSGH
jgi:hypothetical protein